jgi:PAS domain S-box-containing protein
MTSARRSQMQPWKQQWMQQFRDLPIARKLLLTILATLTAALVLSAAGIVIADSVLFRGYLQRDFTTLAQIIADNSVAPLAFNDPRTAADTLATLKARAHLVTACVYGADGRLFAAFKQADVPSACPPEQSHQEAAAASGDQLVFRPIVLNGRPIGKLVLRYDLGELAERRTLYGATVLLVLVLSSLVAVLFSGRLRKTIAAPIAQLVDATKAVADTGDYGIRVEKLSGDELGLLVDRFNEMLSVVESRDGQLRTALRERGAALIEAERARERFHFMAESMPQKIFTAEPGGKVDYPNRQWAEFSGLSAEELDDWAWDPLVHPDDIEQTLIAWQESIASGDPFHVQHRFRRADGTYRWHLSRALAMRNADENISMWIGSSTDIHEQKEKEDELRRANEDLQQFAYSASHDLQEPIRNVAVYSEIVARRYQGVLDADGRKFLGFLTEGGRRLATLIDDLLAYTKAGAGDGVPGVVDASAVLQEALSDLGEAIRESGATVTAEPLPKVYIAAAHLRQVFQNLIGNALKYRKDEPPRIHISAVPQGAAWRFAVRDNGIGIDPQYKENIFGVFKRLHRDQKYSGTGIGLAICQRVVERYGGRIWVDSAPGNGATFYFTLPQPAQRARPAATESGAG